MGIYNTKGNHVLADLWGVSSSFDDVDYMESIMRDALKIENIEPIGVLTKKFSPQGLTIVMLLEESHYSVHFYSESQYLSTDIYCCGSADPNRILEYFISVLQPIEVYRQYIERGLR